ncbi:MAG: fibrobacter succinogenes major paralogous domain-containing protein [Fibrobacteraceae bacterium]|nr:fibrobacter succinogenes major paralogous domain-containing protein [Fibrobacteraceae bacterium]
MKSKLLTIISMSLLFTGMSFAGQQKGTMKDPRDGQTYKTVKIGKQVWMAENLNYDIKHSYCYDEAPENCQKYGRLYTWAAANYVCPSGWHLPTKEEFETLMSNVGGKETAGKMLKSKQGWDPYEHEFEHALQNGNGIDKYGFNVLPAGLRYSFGNFGDAGKDASFWSATEYGENYAYYLYLYYDGENAYLGHSSKDFAYSVRCLRGSN